MRHNASLVVLTREQLDAFVCAHRQQTGCDEPLTLHPRCHPISPLLAAYDDGVVTMTCASCGGFVAEIAVASHPEHLH